MAPGQRLASSAPRRSASGSGLPCSRLPLLEDVRRDRRFGHQELRPAGERIASGPNPARPPGNVAAPARSSCFGSCIAGPCYGHIAQRDEAELATLLNYCPLEPVRLCPPRARAPAFGSASA